MVHQVARERARGRGSSRKREDTLPGKKKSPIRIVVTLLLKRGEGRLLLGGGGGNIWRKETKSNSDQKGRLALFTKFDLMGGRARGVIGGSGGPKYKKKNRHGILVVTAVIAGVDWLKKSLMPRGGRRCMGRGTKLLTTRGIFWGPPRANNNKEL